jgi:hypothetical protein
MCNKFIYFLFNYEKVLNIKINLKKKSIHFIYLHYHTPY